MRMLFRNLPDNRTWLYPSLVGLVNLPGDREGRGTYYITRSTFQGDGLGPVVGLWVGEPVYIESALPLLPSTSSTCLPTCHTFSSFHAPRCAAAGSCCSAAGRRERPLGAATIAASDGRDGIYRILCVTPKKGPAVCRQL